MERRPFIPIVIALCVVALCCAGCGRTSPAREPATVTGKVVDVGYQELEVGAIITVWIEDLDSDSSEPFARTDVKALPGWEVAGNRHPFDFTIEYDPSRVQSDHRYVVRALIKEPSSRTTTLTPVITRGAPVSGITLEIFPGPTPPPGKLPIGDTRPRGAVETPAPAPKK